MERPIFNPVGFFQNDFGPECTRKFRLSKKVFSRIGFVFFQKSCPKNLPTDTNQTTKKPKTREKRTMTEFLFCMERRQSGYENTANTRGDLTIFLMKVKFLALYFETN
jgi:hypothetical protein